VKTGGLWSDKRTEGKTVEDRRMEDKRKEKGDDQREEVRLES
jgi:hypothetical protein